MRGIFRKILFSLLISGLSANLTTVEYSENAEGDYEEYKRRFDIALPFMVQTTQRNPYLKQKIKVTSTKYLELAFKVEAPSEGTRFLINGFFTAVCSFELEFEPVPTRLRIQLCQLDLYGDRSYDSTKFIVEANLFTWPESAYLQTRILSRAVQLKAPKPVLVTNDDIGVLMTPDPNNPNENTAFLNLSGITNVILDGDGIPIQWLASIESYIHFTKPVVVEKCVLEKLYEIQQRLALP